MSQLSKQALYDITIDPNTDLDNRYEAARKLQAMRLSNEVVAQVVRLYPFWTAAEIAEKLNVPVSTVNGIAGKYGLAQKIC